MKTHQKSKLRIYKIWKGIKTRCFNPHRWNAKNYIGRGIGLSEDWKKFENFYRDMNPTYKDGLSIDRINNSKGYSKENCRWATIKEQSLNKRMHKLTREKVLEIREKYKYGNGRKLAKEYKISPGVVSEIVNKNWYF